MCPRPEKVKRLAMRDTQHGSRPNLPHRQPDGRLVPTPPDVWDKGASTKRCGRRQKKTQLYMYIFCLFSFCITWHRDCCKTLGIDMICLCTMFTCFGMLFSGGRGFVTRTFDWGGSTAAFGTLRRMSRSRPSSVTVL